MTNIAQTVFPDLTMTATHVPSEVEKEISKSQVRWKIGLERGRQKYETDYSTGIAHLKGYRQDMKFSTVHNHGVLEECLSKGKSIHPNYIKPGSYKLSVIPPELDDVLSCLMMDAEALEYADFEDWATSYCYDVDSREAERIYNACLKTALALRGMFGEEGLRKLRMAFDGQTEEGRQTGDIKASGMGGFLNPPTHPEHNFCVGIGHDGSMSLSSAVDDDNLDDETRAKARQLLDDWQPLPLDDPKTVAWIRQVLGYFKGCWRNPSVPEPECWHAGKLLCNLPITEQSDIGDHAGVHLIRQWYPEFVPTEDNFLQAKWGN